MEGLSGCTEQRQAGQEAAMTKSGKRPVRLLSDKAKALQPVEIGKIHASSPFLEYYVKRLDSRLDSRKHYDFDFFKRSRGSEGAQQAQGCAAVDEK
mmetsp:Transcript_31151/g.62984  ORF Transcript_31151/g.62984 Transcript_31151/m.62984 type:complete len:96 (-) Transcript_31151:313-600(-)